MFDWWKRRKERKKLEKELILRYPFTTNNPYRAVIWKLSQKLAAHLKRLKMIPHPEETIRQYFFRVSRMIGIDREALFDLLSILEEATYSTHEMGNDEKNIAIGHLRKVEISLDSYVGGCSEPLRAPNEPYHLPHFEKDMIYSLDRYPINDSYHRSRPGDLRRLKMRFDTASPDTFPKTDGDTKDIIDDSIKNMDLRRLEGILLETAGGFQTSVKISDLSGLYLLELGYRSKETHGFDDPDLDGLIGLVVPGAKALAGSEGRNYIIPDDIKMGFLTFLTGYQMRNVEDAVKLVNSVQVPSPNVAEIITDTTAS